MAKKYSASVWGRPLFCPVCGNSSWHKKNIRITDFEKPLPNETRTMLECAHCGYDMLFGMKADWDSGDLNLVTEEIQ